ncbi:hypothetical protein D9613_004814 [Agrocybe pediades]|uniref:DUF6534 domain-containing protein n=1 Tax=Agrocybe pediades TaxID=84607 RepID=A0A8H4QZW8_9AGAR|nr:hypothetical protein D9613_004814 [Agrocybe pediades]
MATPSIQLLFGPMLLGVFINMILYGILLSQAYHYYQTFKRDAPWIKYLVLYLFIVETINTGCDIAMMYQPLINNFGWGRVGKVEATRYFPTLFAAEPIVIVAVSTPIQIFFAWRIRLLTKSIILAAIVVSLSFISLAGGIWTTVLIVKVQEFARKPELHWPALVWFISACAADVLITGVLVVALTKRKTGFVATDDVVSKIIRMTVHTGMLTAFFAIADILFFMILPVRGLLCCAFRLTEELTSALCHFQRTALNFLWDLALSKLYSNCLLSTLNSRTDLQVFVGYQSQQRNGNGAPSSSANRRNMDVPSDERGGAHVLGSSMYELETPPKSFDRRSDTVEFGITITKVVETRQDPENIILTTQ